jgi:hypothetical protein
MSFAIIDSIKSIEPLKMKTVLAITIIPLVCASCTTVGSIDSAKIPAQHADFIAQEMTKELVSYPSPVVTPEGKPLFDAFNRELSHIGWDIEPSGRSELANSSWQDSYLKIHSTALTSKDVLVQLDSPYFTLNQAFYLGENQIFPTSHQTLTLKEYEKK